MKNIRLVTYLKVVCFILLLVVAIGYPKNDIDVIIANLVEIKALETPAKLVSIIFNDKLLLLIMVLLSAFLVYIKEIQKAVFIFFSAGFGGFFLFAIKYLVQRARPLPDVFSGYSFPSGHSTIVAVFFLSLIFIINKKDLLSTIGIIAITLVPISRMILGAHFLSDVVAGVLLGSIIVDFMKVYYKNIYNIVTRFMKNG